MNFNRRILRDRRELNDRACGSPSARLAVPKRLITEQTRPSS
jgi:hypothetical protein